VSVRGVKSEKTNLLLARKLGSSSVFPGITGTVHIGDVQEADLRISGHAGDVEVIGGSGTHLVIDELAGGGRIKDRREKIISNHPWSSPTVSFSSLLGLPAELQALSFELVDDLLLIEVASTAAESACPGCQCQTSRIHSHYRLKTEIRRK
jgi:hypothetical protein